VHYEWRCNAEGANAVNKGHLRLQLISSRRIVTYTPGFKAIRSFHGAPDLRLHASEEAHAVNRELETKKKTFHIPPATVFSDRDGTHPLVLEQRTRIHPRPHGRFAPHNRRPFALLRGCRKCLLATEVASIKRLGDARHAFERMVPHREIGQRCIRLFASIRKIRFRTDTNSLSLSP